MRIQTAHLWILILSCLGWQHVTLGQDVTEAAVPPAEQEPPVVEEVIVRQTVQPRGDRGLEAETEPTEELSLDEIELGLGGLIIPDDPEEEEEEEGAPSTFPPAPAAEEAAVTSAPAEDPVEVTDPPVVVPVAVEIETPIESPDVPVAAVEDSAASTVAPPVAGVEQTAAPVEGAAEPGTTAAAAVNDTEQTTAAPTDPAASDILGKALAEEQAASTAAVVMETNARAAAVTTETEVLTTEAQVEEGTTATPTTTKAPSTDPCDLHVTLDSPWRHVSRGVAKPPRDDKRLVGGWYSFKIGGRWAQVPTTPIKMNHCGSEYPYHLALPANTSLPAYNRTLEAELCTSVQIQDYYEECLMRMRVVVKRCASFFVYQIKEMKAAGSICVVVSGEAVPYEAIVNPEPTQPVPTVPITEEPPLPIQRIEAADLTEEQSEALVTMEIKHPNKTLDRNWFLAFESRFRQQLAAELNEPEQLTTAAPQQLPTTADLQAGPTEAPAIIDEIKITSQQAVNPETVQKQEQHVNEPSAVPPAPVAVEETGNDTAANSINMEVEVPGNIEAPLDVDLNDPTDTTNPLNAEEPFAPSRRRRAANATNEITPDDVTYVTPTPRVQRGQLQMSFYVQDKDGNVIPAEKLLRALEKIKDSEEFKGKEEIEITDTYRGLAVEGVPVEQASRPNIWEAHRGLWVTIIVMVLLCLLVLLLCFVCLLCCRKHEYSPNEKRPLREAEEGGRAPLGSGNPVADDVMTRDEAPMVECQNPAFSNGGGGHLSLDDDNGHIVPLHEMRDEDFQAGQENTKL